jgi:hypothetical protein
LRRGLWYVSGALLFVGLLLWLTMGHRGFRVEVCMAYGGRTACRIASGATESAALQMAVSNACTFLAAGMTDSMACEHSTPVSVKWLERKQ